MWGNGQGCSAPNSMAPRLFRGPGTIDSFLTQEFQQLLLSLLRNAVSSLFVSLPLLASGSGDGLTSSKQDYHWPIISALFLSTIYLLSSSFSVLSGMCFKEIVVLWFENLQSQLCFECLCSDFLLIFGFEAGSCCVAKIGLHIYSSSSLASWVLC